MDLLCLPFSSPHLYVLDAFLWLGISTRTSATKFTRLYALLFSPRRLLQPQTPITVSSRQDASSWATCPWSRIHHALVSLYIRCKVASNIVKSASMARSIYRRKCLRGPSWRCDTPHTYLVEDLRYDPRRSEKSLIAIRMCLSISSDKERGSGTISDTLLSSG